jgi:nucleotide-binding universal stress UspA family protein
MYKFNKILVALDHTDMDNKLIDAVCSICQTSGSKHIYFVNLIRDFQFPEDMLKEFPDIVDKVLADRRKVIEDEIMNRFACEGVKVHFIIKQGQPTKEIMKLTADEKIDLILLGRKNKKKGGGTIINRLARRIGCSILIIPVDSEFKLNRVHVPLDFSSYSKMAMEKAVELAKSSHTPVKIITQNVYQVPSGYHYTGKTFDEFAEIMEKNAEKDYHNLVAGMKLDGLDIENTYTLDKDEDVISTIYQHASQNIKADLIIIGAKGRTATTALFIGSKAEKLIRLDSQIPVMIVRPKGKAAGLREYIKEL